MPFVRNTKASDYLSNIVTLSHRETHIAAVRQPTGRRSCYLSQHLHTGDINFRPPIDLPLPPPNPAPFSRDIGAPFMNLGPPLPLSNAYGSIAP